MSRILVMVIIVLAMAAARGESIDSSGASPSTNITASQSSLLDADLYSQCTGHPFFSTNCVDGSCADTGLSSRLYAAWKQRLMFLYKLTDSDFTSRIEIGRIELTDGPKYVFWSIEYIFKLDWVRSRQVDVVNLGKPPLSGVMSDDKLRRMINSHIRDDRRFNLASVVPISNVKAVFDTCGQGMGVDWCHIKFENVIGTLSVHALETVNLASNQCREASVDIETGKLLHCSYTPCAINAVPTQVPSQTSPPCGRSLCGCSSEVEINYTTTLSDEDGKPIAGIELRCDSEADPITVSDDNGDINLSIVTKKSPGCGFARCRNAVFSDPGGYFQELKVRDLLQMKQKTTVLQHRQEGDPETVSH